MTDILSRLHKDVAAGNWTTNDLPSALAYNQALDDVREALTSPPPSVLDDMMDEYDEHTSLVNETGHGYFCVARDCGYRSDTADLARRHAIQKALAAAAGGDE